MDHPILLVLAASRRLMVKAAELGIDVLHADHSSMSPHSLRALCRGSYEVDPTAVDDVVSLARELHEQFELAAVISNHEVGCVAAEAASRELGLAAPGVGVAVLLRDKLAMRARFGEHPRLAAPFSKVADSGDIKRFGDAHSYPVMLKPRDGSASLGTFRIDREEDIERVFREAQEMLAAGHKFSALLPLGEYMVEPYFEGLECSVETFSRGGRHEVLGITQTITNEGFVEIGHVVPAPLSQETSHRVQLVVSEFLDVVELREGPAHTEVMVSGESVFVIESHSRTAGGGIPDLVALATGRDIEKEMLAHFAGQSPPVPEAPRGRAAAKVFLWSPVDGVVEAIEGVDAARDVPGVQSVDFRVSVGSEVSALRASWDTLGQVVATGDDSSAALDTARSAAELVRVSIRPPVDG